MVRAQLRRWLDLGTRGQAGRKERARRSSCSLAVEQFEDRCCPTVTISLAAGQDNGPSSTDNFASTITGLTLTGTNTNPSPVLGVAVFMSTNGQDPVFLDPLTPVSGGTWSFTVQVPLEVGNVYKFYAGDPITNEFNSNADVIIDTVENAPTALALAAASDTGVQGDNRTKDSTPTITGKADKALATLGEGESLPFNFQTSVTLFEGATQIGSGTINAITGDWSVTVTTALADGTYQITARATDLAGNTSSASTALSITIDTTAPDAPTGLTLHSSTDSGTLGDNLTSFNKPRVTGTAEPNSTVQLFDGATALTPTAVADGAGNWSITLTNSLSDGVHDLTAKATDQADNTSSSSTILAVTIDTTAPTAPGNLTLHSSTDSGAVGDNLTNFNKPQITGTAEPNSTVRLFDGVTALTPTTVADEFGNWSITLANSLSDGAHNLTARSTDGAGNTSSASSGLTVSIDTTATAPSGLVLAPGSDDGTPNDNITSVRTPTILGTAEANSTVRVFINGALAGTPTAGIFGDWTFTSPFLADGVYSFTAVAIDRAANSSVPSAPLVVTIQQPNAPPPPPSPVPGAPSVGLAPASFTNVLVEQQPLAKKPRRRMTRRVTLINAGTTTINGPLSLMLAGLNRKIKVAGTAGTILTVSTPGAFLPGAKLTVTLVFSNPELRKVNYTPLVVTD